MTLLEKAVSAATADTKKRKTLFTDPEKVELALAWANREVNIYQVMVAIGDKTTGSAQASINSWLATAIRTGYLTVQRSKEIK